MCVNVWKSRDTKVWMIYFRSERDRSTSCTAVVGLLTETPGLRDEKMSKYTQRNLKITAQRLYQSKSDGLSCTGTAEAMLRLPRPVTLAEVEHLAPALWAHLHLCADCMGEFELFLTLHNAADLDAAVKMIKTPPLPNQSSWVERMAALAESLLTFPGFQPLDLAPTRGEKNTLSQVDILLNDQLTLEIDPAPNEQNRAKWDLFLTLSVNDGDDLTRFGPVSAQILYSESGEAVDQVVFDKWGDAFLGGLTGDEPYDLLIFVENDLFRIQSIPFPAS